MLTDHPTPDALSFALDDPQFAAPIAAHVASCHSCRAAVASLEQVRVRAALLCVAVVPPDHLWYRIESCVAHRPRKPEFRWRVRAARRAPLGALAALLLVIVLGTWLVDYRRTQVTGPAGSIAPFDDRIPAISLPLLAARPLPNAADVLARNALAVGDLKGRVSVVLAGTIDAVDLPRGTRFERYLDRTGRVFHRNFAGNDSTRAATVREVAEDDFVFGAYHHGAALRTATVTEWADFFGCTCAKVQVTLAQGTVRNEYKEYYDGTSGLLTGIVREDDATHRLPGHLVVLRKYRSFDGVNLPTDITEMAGAAQWRLVVETVHWNVPAPAASAARLRR